MESLLTAGRPPTDAERAEAVGLPLRRVQHLDHIQHTSSRARCASTDQLRGSRRELALLAELSVPSPGESLEAAQAREAVATCLEAAMSELRPRERFVLERRFGLSPASGGAPSGVEDGSGGVDEPPAHAQQQPSLKVVGEALGGISPPRVKELETSALRKIRKSVHSTELRQALLEFYGGRVSTLSSLDAVQGDAPHNGVGMRMRRMMRRERRKSRIAESIMSDYV